MSDSNLPSGADAAPSDKVDAGIACTILGDPQSTFEHRRGALELVLDRTTGLRAAVPQFDNPQAEKDWRARACLVVPEWGGIKVPYGKWWYSRAALTAYRQQPYAAVLAALPHTRSCCVCHGQPENV